jgi:RNA polymerase sigma factor (sigma-70 family)
MSRLLSMLLVQLRSAAQPRVDRVSDGELLARFVRNRDASAFELLFWRHGPMIWGVCRRLLGNSADADDAYQAVFVVLARKAATIGRGEALAGWLHRVAHRTALNARTAQRRRSARERPVTDLPETPALDDPVRRTVNRELKDLLDQELLRLPEKFRQPVLLCDLEERSHEEAAVALNCPLGTLNSRLARGRQKLKERLLSRGVTLTALAVTAAPQAVSAAALDAVLRTPSASVRALADGAIKALAMSAMKKIAVGVALCGLLFAGLAYGAVFAAKKATTPASALASETAADDSTSARPKAADIEQQAVVIGKVVDEADRPVAGATVKAPGFEKCRPTTSGADGAFRLELGYPAPDWLHAVLLVEDAKGRLGYLYVSQKKPEPVQVVLKPARETGVMVTDGDRNPVAGAEVCFLGDMARLIGGRTDAAGRWTGRVPADVRDWSVFARKANVGFDYVVSQNYRSPESKPKPVPAQLPLTLDGARTLRVKTVDRAGKPIAGVKVGPWYIQMPGHDGDINLSGTTAHWPKTGKDGAVAFDWLPTRFAHSLSIMVASADYYSLDTATLLMLDKPTDEMTIEMLPLERLSGRVTHPGGQTAGGIQLTVAGQGGGHNRFQRTTRTGPDGRFSIRVYSEQAYVIAVTDEKWSAPYRGDVVVRAGKPVDGIDFMLCRATRLHGRVTVGKAGTLAKDTYIRADIDLGEIPKELRKKGDRVYHPVAMHFNTRTDKDGRYEFRLGPGAYKLHGPGLKETVPLTIPAGGPSAEIVRDFHMPRPETGPLAVLVVDAAGRPVAGARVDGLYAAYTSHWFRQVKTDAQGRFNVKRGMERLVLCARTADGKRAGLARIDADAPEVKIVVGELASATGTLLDLKGKPLVGRKLNFGIRIHMGESENSSFTDYFGGVATTDAKGRFTLQSLIPGQAYEVNIQPDENTYRGVTRVQPKKTAAIDLGDLRVDPAPNKPYVPPTPAQRTAKTFAPAKTTSPHGQKARVLAESAREYTRPLLLFGQPRDPACIELFRLFNEDDESDGQKNWLSPSKLRWEFELASLDTDKPEVRKLAADLGVMVSKGRPPVLAILNADGSLAATYPLVLDRQQMLDSAKLTAFLVKHKPPTRDAQKMLADALRKAKAEDKHVFFISSASWCGPCRLLSRFLAARKKELERHYVFVKLDISRDKRAEAVRKRYQGDKDGSVPWYAILDADGKMLGNSSVPDSKRRGNNTRNIGFPSDAADVEHFVKMIEQTAPRMAKEEIGELRKALKAR